MPIRQVCVPVNISNAHWILVVADLAASRIEVWDPMGSDHDSIVKNIQVREGLGVEARGG